MRTFFCLAFLFLLFLLTACTSDVICSSPYVLIGNACCVDADHNAVCDPASSTPPPPEKSIDPQPSSETLDREVISYRGLLDDDPILGNQHASLVLVVFGDYQDKFSQRFHLEVLPKLLETYGPSLSYVYRDYRASPNNRFSESAAQAANCADEQGSFWEYHEILYHHISDLFPSSLLHYAQELGLDVNRFRLCLDGGKYQSEVLDDFSDGNAAGVTLTPTFFLNDQKIVGFRTFDYFDSLIREQYATFLSPEILSAPGEEFFIDYSQTAKANLILPGPAVLDPTISFSPYSNTLDLIDASFSAHLLDRAAPNGSSLDSASFSADLSYTDPVRHTKHTYTLFLTNLSSAPSPLSSAGGIAVDTSLYGQTGIGTSLLPRVTARVALWGLADLYEDRRVIASSIPFTFVVTQGMRSEGALQSTSDPSDVEAYLFFPTDYQSRDPPLPFPNSYAYLLWENLTLKTL